MDIIVGKVEGINTSDGVLNLVVVDDKDNNYNIKCSTSYKEIIVQNSIYKFHVNKLPGKLVLDKLEKIESLKEEEILNTFSKFGLASPISYEKSVTELNRYLDKIDSKIIYDITKGLVDKYHKDFFTYPAASKMHHAYAGGLVYHTIGMLNMADAFLANYPYLNKNYLYAGIILHDIGKTTEFSGIQSSDYSIKGQLIGHLVIGSIEVAEIAKELGYSDCEETMILEHMLISHHGQPQFGAAKKPMTAEALVLWYIDTIDSKFRVLGDELAKVNFGEFTDTIGVLDRIKVYKPKDNN